MSTFQFLFLRGSVGFLINLVMINRDLKKVVWDTVGSDTRINLAAKVAEGVLTVFVQFSAIKYFSLTYCTALRNLSPFIALVFSALILREPATPGQVILLTAVVSLVIGFIFAGDEETQESLLTGQSQLTIVFAWVCLLSSPIILAAGAALTRALRKLHENTVNIYSNFFQIFTFLAITLAVGEKANHFMEFNWIEWIVMVGCSFFQVLSAIFKFKASQKLPIPVQ